MCPFVNTTPPPPLICLNDTHDTQCSAYVLLKAQQVALSHLKLEIALAIPASNDKIVFIHRIQTPLYITETNLWILRALHLLWNLLDIRRTSRKRVNEQFC